MPPSDPFQCFGDDDDDDSSTSSTDASHDGGGGGEKNVVNTPAEKDSLGSSKDELAAAAPRRDPSCGVCAFHNHTEASLLAHVRNSLPSSSSTQDDSSTKERTAADFVLEAVDDYCATRHWMMHVGPEKGAIVAGALRSAVETKLLDDGDDMVPFVVVELGSYCGYASVLLGRELALARRRSNKRLACHLFTTEIREEYADVAEEMIRLADLEGGDDTVSLHRVSFNGFETDVVDLVRDAVRTWKKGGEGRAADIDPTIDFLFIDHDKDAYLSDLRRFESSGMVRKGTRVVADNVVFAGIDDYVDYVRWRAEEGSVRTNTVICSVEYSGVGSDNHDCDNGENDDGDEANVRDGIEITDYLKNPLIFLRNKAK